MAAEEAFARLTPRIERFLYRYLAHLLPKHEDREDVVSTTLSRIWQRRTAFRVQGVSGWWSYVAKAGRRCALSKLGEDVAAESVDEDAIEECSGIELLALYADDRRRLYEAADRLWLKVEPDLSPIERKRRLLAAQLVFLHDVSPKSVPEFIGPGRHSRDEVDRWLSSEPTLLDLAYHELFWDNDELTRHVLGLGDEDHGLDWWIAQVEARPSGNAPNGMPWDEVAVIVWHFYYAMSPERILVRAGTLEQKFVDGVLARAEERVPHCELIRRLATAFSVSWIRSRPLANPGLWKRLVFQYCVHSGLPHKRILQYTQPAAAVVGHKITKGMINVWLSNGRLFSQLANFAQEASL